MARILCVFLTSAVLLPSCSPKALSEEAPILPRSAIWTAELPQGWIVKRGESFDSTNGTITTSQGLRIACDIGPMAASFSEPDPAKCVWRWDGLDPDFYAWRRTDSPRRVQVLIRNLNPMGGAYWFTFTPLNPEDVVPIIQQLLASHEWILARLIQLSGTGVGGNL